MGEGIVFIGVCLVTGEGSALGGRGWSALGGGACLGRERVCLGRRGLNGGGRSPFPPRYSQPAVGTHPTGMHSYLITQIQL